MKTAKELKQILDDERIPKTKKFIESLYSELLLRIKDGYNDCMLPIPGNVDFHYVKVCFEKLGYKIEKIGYLIQISIP